MNKSLFVVENALLNSIFAGASDALAHSAAILKRPQEAHHHRNRAAWTASAITDHSHNKEDGVFYNHSIDSVIRADNIIAIEITSVSSESALISLPSRLYEPKAGERTIRYHPTSTPDAIYHACSRTG